jgi:hypothetical protein
MPQETVRTEARVQYEAAHALQYQTNDPLQALKLYMEIMVAHPKTREASYSRSQILNIVSSVVPEQELFDAQVAMAMAHFEEEN